MDALNLRPQSTAAALGPYEHEFSTTEFGMPGKADAGVLITALEHLPLSRVRHDLPARGGASPPISPSFLSLANRRTLSAWRSELAYMVAALTRFIAGI